MVRHPAVALETVISQIVAIKVGVVRIASGVGEVMSVTIVLLAVMQDTWLMNAIETEPGYSPRKRLTTVPAGHEIIDSNSNKSLRCNGCGKVQSERKKSLQCSKCKAVIFVVRIDRGNTGRNTNCFALLLNTCRTGQCKRMRTPAIAPLFVI